VLSEWKAQRTTKTKKGKKMDMTNKEYYGCKTLNEALAKFQADNDLGIANCGFRHWLNCEWHDPAATGRVIRGKFYTDADIEAKIRAMESKPVTGYLLEFKRASDEDYKPSEFATAMRTNRYAPTFDGQAETEDWYNDEVWVGYFADLPDVWLDDGDTWDERCGVDFDVRKTPVEKPSPNGTWEGVCVDGCWKEPTKWRVRKVMVNGRLSDKARRYFRKFPHITMEHDWI
jgi:hypothetical protein